jgi:hypothetical protein
MGIRQGAQEHRVDHAEDRGRRTDAEGEGGGRGECKGRRPPQDAHRVPEIR